MTLMCRTLVRRGAATLAAAAGLFWFTTSASAQLDPLLFLKRVPPTVIIAVDTSFQMQTDVNGDYYDPNFYLTDDDPLVANALGIGALGPAESYRRVYRNIQYEGTQDANSKFIADRIVATPMLWNPSNPATANAPSDVAWLNPTRLSIAKRGISLAVGENAGPGHRWGLVKLRQDAPEWRVSPNCDRPVRLLNQPGLLGLRDSNPCGAPPDRFVVYAPTVDSPNYSIEGNGSLGSPVVVPTGANTSATVLAALNRPVFDPLGLIPAGRGTNSYSDRPIAHLLDDARAQAVAAVTSDTAACRGCRNTIVVLITSGKDVGDPTYDSAHDAPAVASTFLNLTAAGVTKRVPIYVIGLNPPAGDVAELQAIAANSGGRYFNATDAAGVARVVNLAVQNGFARPSDFDTSTSSEFTPVSPIIGTVNLKGASDATGAALPATDIQSIPGGQPIPQRSNVMLTAGFALPGFDGRLRAFRVFKPVADATKPSGWKFVKDGTRLWPDLDGRPQLAGLARTPSDPAKRNIYTFIPDGFGGGDVVAFNAANATSIEPHLALPSGSDLTAADLITALRSLPIGAIIGSTPALMDAPSLDPPPDADYGRPDGSATFAGTHKDRRSLIFFGANDGMIHCVDARTGYEVWAFIPYNLLPKLRTLLDGQPVEQFDYFVDSSPKIAEVKMTMPDSSHQWRSLLIIGEGPGGIFYQAFDVTEAGMTVAPDSGNLSSVGELLGMFDAPDESIKFLWSFPNYSSFDPAYTATFTVTDGSPGGKIKLFGDLRTTASNAEKSVGFSWSDPAVGPMNVDRTVNAVMVGSGYFPDIEDQIPSRGPASPRAGRSFYTLRVEDGKPIGNASGGSCTGNGCLDLGDASNGRKNALQADPTAAGLTYSHIVSKAYIGDVDGSYWRLNLDANGTIAKVKLMDAGQPIYASSALLFVGSTDQYAFFATGSDLLASTAPGGTGTFSLYGLKDNYPGPAGLKFTRNLAPVSSVGGLTTGERPSTSPSVAGDIVFYTTTSETALTPCADFLARLYSFTYLGGAAYDTNNNARMDTNESPVIKTVAGRATAPFIVDQHLYFGTAGADGAQVEGFGDPEDFNNGVGQIGVRILSWREIR
jgi:Neisseria PilC beta-propeller domain